MEIPVLRGEDPRAHVAGLWVDFILLKTESISSFGDLSSSLERCRFPELHVRSTKKTWA